ncbi:hypothetical protein BKH45_06845 [Helicobacter sp. 11S03491-1]|nr:hypothetical protein BKH45_06845 [Helicobacter sp. 11S03491-1]
MEEFPALIDIDLEYSKIKKSRKGKGWMTENIEFFYRKTMGYCLIVWRIKSLINKNLKSLNTFKSYACKKFAPIHGNNFRLGTNIKNFNFLSNLKKAGRFLAKCYYNSRI